MKLKTMKIVRKWYGRWKFEKPSFFEVPMENFMIKVYPCEYPNHFFSPPYPLL